MRRTRLGKHLDRARQGLLGLTANGFIARILRLSCDSLGQN